MFDGDHVALNHFASNAGLNVVHSTDRKANSLAHDHSRASLKNLDFSHDSCRVNSFDIDVRQEHDTYAWLATVQYKTEKDKIKYHTCYILPTDPDVKDTFIRFMLEETLKNKSNAALAKKIIKWGLISLAIIGVIVAIALAM